MGPEATRFLKRVAVKLAAKTREKYSDVMNNIRTRISFEILRSVLVAVRGVRSIIRQMKVDPISTLAFNLIPHKFCFIEKNCFIEEEELRHALGF